MVHLNILDTKPIDSLFKNISDVAEFSCGKWLRTVLKNYVKKTETFFIELPREQVNDIIQKMKDPPRWLVQAYYTNTSIHSFDPIIFSAWYTEIMRPVLDWWRSLPEDDPHQKNWHKISVPEAIELTRKWHEQLAKKRADEHPEDWDGLLAVCELPGDYKAYKLTSARALEREGRLLGHCVAGYWEYVQFGRCEIWSIRDQHNIPHVTLETIDNKLVQMSGTANTRPTKYTKQIISLVRNRKLNVGHFAEQLGVFYICGNYYSEIDQILNDMDTLWKQLQKEGFIYSLKDFTQLIKILQFNTEELTSDVLDKLLEIPLKTKLKANVSTFAMEGTKLLHGTICLPNALYLLWNSIPAINKKREVLEKLFAMGLEVIMKINLNRNVIFDFSSEHRYPNKDSHNQRFEPLLPMFSSFAMMQNIGLEKLLTEAQHEAKTIQLIELKNASSDIMRIINGKDRHKLTDKKRDELIHTLRVKLPRVEQKLRVRPSPFDIIIDDPHKRHSLSKSFR